MKNVQNLSEKAQAFLAQNPTHLGTIGDIKFYEHPTLGDEVTIRMIGSDGKVKCSGCWDMESVYDEYRM